MFSFVDAIISLADSTSVMREPAARELATAAALFSRVSRGLSPFINLTADFETFVVKFDIYSPDIEAIIPEAIFKTLTSM
jgi:hypothetical protein